MSLLAGKNWSGTLRFNITAKASGSVNGHSWYLQSRTSSWTLEIASEQDIEPTDLPLVGYGCAGWLYECEQQTLPNNEADYINYLNKELPLVFELFNQNKLKFLPSVTCPCSD